MLISTRNATILIVLIFLVLLTANCFAKPIKCGDVVKIISSKDSSEIIGILKHKDTDRIGLYSSYKGLRYFSSSEVLNAYAYERPRKGAIKAGAGIGMLLGGAIACYFEWPRKAEDEWIEGSNPPFTTYKKEGEYHDTNLWVILAGIVGGGLLGAGIGYTFGDYVEVKTDDLFGHDPGRSGVSVGKPTESIILSVKLKL